MTLQKGGIAGLQEGKVARSFALSLSSFALSFLQFCNPAILQ
jgi:hypothetical protein